MNKIVVIGGIESSYINAQLLYDLGEEILMFYTRGPKSPGWEGVDFVDSGLFPFSSQVNQTMVNGNINDYVGEIRDLNPDYIWSLGWQQIFRKELLDICPVIGLHESLLPEGAGASPIANAILHEREITGVTLFQVDEGMDTGQIIAQMRGTLSPRSATSEELYREAIELSNTMIKNTVPLLRSGTAPRIPQSIEHRSVYGKLRWEKWSSELVERARTYPYK